MGEALRAVWFGYSFTFGRLRALWLLAAWRIIVTIAILLMADALAAATGGDPLADLQLAGKYLVLALLRILLYATTLSPVAIAWQRAAAGRAELATALRPDFGARSRRYILTVIRLTVAATLALILIWLGGNGLGRLVAAWAEVFFGPVSRAFFLTGLAVMLWAFARLATSIADAALSDTAPRLVASWRRSAGHAGALFAIIALSIAPMALATRLLAHAVAEYGEAAAFAGRLLFEFAAVLSVLVFLAALSRYAADRRWTG